MAFTILRIRNGTFRKGELMLTDKSRTLVRNGALELGISKDSFNRSTRELCFRPFQSYIVVEMSDDFDWREDFAHHFCQA